MHRIGVVVLERRCCCARKVKALRACYKVGTVRGSGRLVKVVKHVDHGELSVRAVFHSLSVRDELLIVGYRCWFIGRCEGRRRR